MAVEYGSLPFAEAIQYLRDKVDIPTARWDDISGQAHDRYFMVAGAAKADLLADLHGAVLKAKEQGTTIETFRKDFAQIVASRGWHGWTGEGTQAGEAWRTRVIYATNLRTSYAAGRYSQMKALADRRPYWRYKHNDTVAHPRQEHQAWDGTVLRHDDPWWDTHYTPNGWGCRCYIETLAPRDLEREGITPGEAPDDGTYTVERHGVTHTLPKGVDYGWDHAPGKTRDLAAELKDKERRYPAGLAADFAAAQRRVAQRPSFAFMGQRPGLAALPALPVTVLSGAELGSDLGAAALAKAADAWLRQVQGGAGLYNADTGWMLRVNKASRKKMGDNAAQTPPESQAVAGLVDLVRAAVVAERHADEAHANPDVTAVARLYAPLQIGGRLYRVKLTAKEYLEGGRVLHALEAAEIENAPSGIFPSYSGAGALQTGQPTTGRTLSIAELLRGARRQDGTAYALEVLEGEL